MGFFTPIPRNMLLGIITRNMGVRNPRFYPLAGPISRGIPINAAGIRLETPREANPRSANLAAQGSPTREIPWRISRPNAKFPGGPRQITRTNAKCMGIGSGAGNLQGMFSQFPKLGASLAASLSVLGALKGFSTTPTLAKYKR